MIEEGKRVCPTCGTSLLVSVLSCPVCALRSALVENYSTVAESFSGSENRFEHYDIVIGEDHKPIASGSFDWENRYENGNWSYDLEDVWTGLQESYRKLSKEVFEKLQHPAADHWCHRLQRHDARLFGIRSGRKSTRPVSYMAKHYDRTGSKRAH